MKPIVVKWFFKSTSYGDFIWIIDVGIVVMRKAGVVKEKLQNCPGRQACGNNALLVSTISLCIDFAVPLILGVYGGVVRWEILFLAIKGFNLTYSPPLSKNRETILRLKCFLTIALIWIKIVKIDDLFYIG